jgi:uncharacterized membrane protein
MVNQDAIAYANAEPARPAVRTIGTADIKNALSRGFDDFRAMPTHAMFLCLIYPLVAFFLARLTFGMEVLTLFYPLLSGFALIGPFAAIGLYELSRRREQGLEASWRHAFAVLQAPSIRAIATVGVALMAIFIAWLTVAQAIYEATFGSTSPGSLLEFIRQVFTTPSGWVLIIVGNGVGFLFAAVALTVSVVSLPLLLDRNIGAAMAIQTSVRAVRANPKTMALWGLIVAGALVIDQLPATNRCLPG